VFIHAEFNEVMLQNKKSSIMWMDGLVHLPFDFAQLFSQTIDVDVTVRCKKKKNKKKKNTHTTRVSYFVF
jgi:hypothetical protein